MITKTHPASKYKTGLYLMALLYISAGIVHLVNPDFYLRIIPLWLPWHILLVFVSGLSEIILGAMLLLPTTRRFSAWLIIIMLLIFFFLIHIPMAFAYTEPNKLFTWLIWLRLPVQFLLIAWAYIYARKKDAYRIAIIHNHSV